VLKSARSADSADGRYLQAAACVCALCGKMKDKAARWEAVNSAIRQDDCLRNNQCARRDSREAAVPCEPATHGVAASDRPVHCSPHPPHVSATCQCQLTVAAASGHIKARRQPARTVLRCPRQCALPGRSHCSHFLV